MKKDTRNQLLMALLSISSISGNVSAVTPYDFGSYKGYPRSFATNPALSSFCENNMNFGLSTRSSNIKISANNRLVSPDQPANGALEFGGCLSNVDWITTGGYMNLSTLSFNFTTETLTSPSAFPYNRNALPVGAFGGGIRLTESIYAGLSWKVIENVDISINQILMPEIATGASVNVRPKFAFVAGAAYQWNQHLFHFAHSPEIKGNLEIDVSAPIQFDPLNLDFSLDVLFVSGAISYIPAETTFGYWTETENWTLDTGLILEQWSKLDDIFLDFTLPLGIDEVLFNTTNFKLNDTLTPYLIFSVPTTFLDIYPGKWSFGYSYRGSVVPNDRRDLPLRGADLHTFKAGIYAEVNLEMFRVGIDSHLVYGYLIDAAEATGVTVDGDTYSLNVSATIKF